MKMGAKSSLWDQFWQFWLFFDDRKPLGLAHLGPFSPTRRFSTRSWRASRCPQLWQQFAHPATHVLRSCLALLVFPWTKLGGNAMASQDQKIVGNGHEKRPPLKLFGRAQSRFCPQQALFVKAIAVFLAKATDISQANVRDVCLLVAKPDEPTHARISLFVGRVRAHNADDRHFQPPSSLDMYGLPPGNRNGTFFGILALPMTIWVPMRRFIVGLQFVPILAWCSSLACACGSTSVKTAIAFQADQRAFPWQGAASAPKPERVVSSIQHADGVLRQPRHHTLHLGKSHLSGRCVRTHALLIQDVGPTAGGLRQGYYRRELPSIGHRFVAIGQIMHMLRAPIRRGDRLRASYATGIYPNPQRFFWAGIGQIPGKHFLQVVLVYHTVFQCLIQAWPLTLKMRRQRQFWERLRSIFGQQGVNDVKQSIFGSSKTAICIVTKCFDCVKVQSGHAPFIVWLIWEQYSLWQSFARE